MSAFCFCPHCGGDLRAAPIPVESLHMYSPIPTCPEGRFGFHSPEWSEGGGLCTYCGTVDHPEPDRLCGECGEPRHFSNLIGVYDRDRDRTTEWLCPLCDARWPR